MSEIYGTTSTPQETTRELGSVDTSPTSGSSTSGTDAYGTDSHGTDSPVASPVNRPGSGSTTATADRPSGHDSTTDVVKEEARTTGQQAKDGAKHVADVGKDEAMNVVQETGQQAKELWQQTRGQLLDQSAQQQTRVAEGLRSLSQELTGMARSSEQQGVASDLAQQAAQRMDSVAGWLDQRDPGSLVSEVKQFARQRPGTFLVAAAAIGLVGGRLSRGLVADHQEQSAHEEHTDAAAAYGGDPTVGHARPSSGTDRGTYTGSHSTGGTTTIADPDAFPA